MIIMVINTYIRFICFKILRFTNNLLKRKPILYIINNYQLNVTLFVKRSTFTSKAYIRADFFFLNVHDYCKSLLVFYDTRVKYLQKNVGGRGWSKLFRLVLSYLIGCSFLFSLNQKSLFYCLQLIFINEEFTCHLNKIVAFRQKTFTCYTNTAY